LNPSLVPSSNIVLGGSGTTRTATITPIANQLGSATISISVNDGSQTTNRDFNFSITGSALETWRFENFGTTANVGNAADDADPDHDGSTNVDENAAGTDPNDPADLFKILTVSKSGSTFTATVSGKTGRTYTLQRASSLNGPWPGILTTGPLTQDGEISLTDPAAPSNSAYYRIEVFRP
jgi:hypothetical protein